jgi:hypothetical protein
MLAETSGDVIAGPPLEFTTPFASYVLARCNVTTLSSAIDSEHTYPSGCDDTTCWDERFSFIGVAGVTVDGIAGGPYAAVVQLVPPQPFPSANSSLGAINVTFVELLPLAVGDVVDCGVPFPIADSKYGKRPALLSNVTKVPWPNVVALNFNREVAESFQAPITRGYAIGGILLGVAVGLGIVFGVMMAVSCKR